MKKINKSDEIRKHLSSSKDHSPAAVVKALKAKGVKVSRGLVSVVKHTRMKGFKAHRFAKHAEILSRARSFIVEAGGPDEAKQLIDIIHKIIS